MNIVIPTKGREGNQMTLSHLPESLRIHTTLFIPEGETHNHPKIYVEPRQMHKGEKVQHMLDGFFGRKFIMCDDDLRFSSKALREDRLHPASEEEIEKGFHKVWELLDTHPIVGIHQRFMGHLCESSVVPCGRTFAAFGVNIDLLPSGIENLNSWMVCEDAVLQLSVLSKGGSTPVIGTLFWDQCGGSNASGGCSTYRTPEVQKEHVLRLKEKFPEFVTLKEKAPVSGWFAGAPRLDYILYVSKAYKKFGGST